MIKPIGKWTFGPRADHETLSRMPTWFVYAAAGVARARGRALAVSPQPAIAATLVLGAPDDREHQTERRRGCPSQRLRSFSRGQAQSHRRVHSWTDSSYRKPRLPI